jgi:hypothetical protein
VSRWPSPGAAAEFIDALVSSGEDPEVVRITAKELDLLRLGVPVDEEPLFDADDEPEPLFDADDEPEPLPSPDEPEYAELVAKGFAFVQSMPSSVGAKPLLPKAVAPRTATAVRVQTRPREHRARPGRSRARSPGRLADDEADLAPHRRVAA